MVDRESRYRVGTEQTSSTDRTSREYNTPAVAFTIFAAVLIVMAGSFQLVAGLSALVGDDFYLSSQRGLLRLDATRWGWVHLALGVLLIAAGMALFGGFVWARVVAVIVALVSAVSNFVWLPHYPAWGLAIIALDGFVIWAVTVHGRDITRV